jgi:hypothetical protein
LGRSPRIGNSVRGRCTDSEYRPFDASGEDMTDNPINFR